MPRVAASGASGDCDVFVPRTLVVCVATMEPPTASRIQIAALPRWRRGLAGALRRRLMPMVEVGTLARRARDHRRPAISSSPRSGSPARLLTPPLVALLLVANLVPLMGLLVLLGAALAKGRAARSGVGGSARLHVRLVALFSVIASVPTLLVVIFASLLFQYGVEFWFSDRARTVLENADSVAQAYVEENKQRIVADVVVDGRRRERLFLDLRHRLAALCRGARLAGRRAQPVRGGGDRDRRATATAG